MEFGGSLAVPNVQQLASSSNDVVPIRYIRPELEFERVFDDEYSGRIPVIDIGKLVSAHENDEESTKLHSACKDWGFFQVINHGVAEEVVLNMKADVQEFFRQPLQEKMECAQQPNDLEGYGQAFVVSEDQKLDWGDMLYILTRPLDGRNMRFWPRVPSSFRATLGEYSSALEKLSVILLSSMAKNLGIDPEKLLSLFKEGAQGIRMNYYPPCKEAGRVVGLTQHSDAGGLTLLTQVNQVQGLQIKRDGKWVPIAPISGAFIVNVGDTIEIMSNGEYKSIEHRAVVNLEKERLSVAAFHGTNLNAMIGPLPALVDGDQKPAPNYKTMSTIDYFKLVISCKLDGKGLLASTSKDVPSRYIRPEFELDRVSSDESVQVPVIDMSKLVDDGELMRLHLACKDWGFFQVINHEVAEEVISKMKDDVQEFFNQPLQEKMEHAQLPNSIEGYGQAFVVSEEQKLDWGDMLYILAQPVNGRNMRTTLDKYSSVLEKLSVSLLSAMAMNLELDPEKLLSLFKEGSQGIRMNYYPPCKKASKVIGLGPHSDAVGLTLLTQVNEVQGLQIRRDGEWVPIIPIPGAFIVNVGDVIEILSNGEYRSIEHRAVVNPEKERLSIAAFHTTNINAMIGPLPDLINKDQKKQQPKYKTISAPEYIKLIISSKLNGKGNIHSMKLEAEA
ncbi:unnamed protein product [Linum tenue]|uniref:Fe2OG dioxygenase domain-containing protein n=1 Tax=Linum tenue TaxID=586396 RepID=A0AAV0KCB9_9ROSI|nr:unnamed protein product [Linum tenue]